MKRTKEVIEMIERKENVSNAAPPRYSALRKAADNLSLRNVDAATVELINEALARLVFLAYEQDGGGYCNMDGATGRVLIPLPWGRCGSTKWGLRPQEANILRDMLFEWQAEDADGLLSFDKGRRAWHVDLHRYPNYHLAKQWLGARQITVTAYREARAKRLSKE